MLYLIAACFVVYMYFQERHKKKVSFMVHCQGKTEDSEMMDFSISLFSDETPGKWNEKINQAFEMMENRRAYQNQRMMDLQKKWQEEQAKLKETQKVVALK